MTGSPRDTSGQHSFAKRFKALTGFAPFPWQERLYNQFVSDRPDNIPEACDLPTGLGKTSVVAVWLIAKLACPERIPTRLVYVVNRRTVVDQTTTEVEKYRERLNTDECKRLFPGFDDELAISTLRGQFADNRQWCEDPSRPAVIVGTVDMIGSRLLFSGYGLGFKSRPLHAGLLGQDSLIVHDEAHLEPAFQKLLDDIVGEQSRCNEFRPMRVMELSATRRGEKDSFKLETEDWEHQEINKRTNAVKQLVIKEIDDEKKIVDEIGKKALEFGNSGDAILVFVRGVDDVAKVVKLLGDKHKDHVAQLTGTMRGFERDRQMDPRRPDACRVFARFLPKPKDDAPETEKWRIEPREGTVYLVCTSAGEVGVNISADHLICDLTTFESMAQRFGRVNRFGERSDTQICVLAPSEPSDKVPYKEQRERTLALLDELKGKASPKALSEPSDEAKQSAFAPLPVILDTSDILFDAWSMTTIKEKLPGRPPVAEYLHGKANWEPPQTQVAWREEVERLEDVVLERFKPVTLLEDFPIKPHELLTTTTQRVEKAVDEIVERLKKERGDEAASLSAWVIDEFGEVTRHRIEDLIKANRQGDRDVDLAGCILLLPPSAGGLAGGFLEGSAPSTNAENHDVSCEWLDAERRKRRDRFFDKETIPPEMRIVRWLDTRPNEDDLDEEASATRYWYWCERIDEADTDASLGSFCEVTWDDHTRDVRANIDKLLCACRVNGDLQRSLQLAADAHDLGKKRILWQALIGRPPHLSQTWFAKSNKKWRSLPGTDYRHEFGSLLDLRKEGWFEKLAPDFAELVCHTVATHHGYGRPHFPVELIFDSEYPELEAQAEAAEVPRRFARLQRRHGRWGLAYLESLLRAADYAASAGKCFSKERGK